MIHDVIIVGAGPCGLAAAARLCENTPSALFTDAEHARYWRRFSHKPTFQTETRRPRGSVKSFGDDGDEATHQTTTGSSGILVLDATSTEWMSTWDRRFDALRISHLRSPLFFHCDPRDRDGLLEFAHAEGRSKELDEINNVVGKEVSKHQKKKKLKHPNCQCRGTIRHLHLDNRDRTDYYTPSSSLFRDYCKRLSDRYKLHNIIQKAEVLNITYEDSDIPTETRPIFKVTTETGQTYLSHAVVLAIGPGVESCVPAEYQSLVDQPGSASSVSHVFTRSKDNDETQLIPPQLDSRLSRPNHQDVIHIAIVGGGLTTAQLAHHVLSTYSRTPIKIHLILRSPLKIKHFDVDLPWVSKLRNRNMAEFWSADTDTERFEMLKNARNGGSMPSKWEKLLRCYEKEDKVVFHCQKKIAVDSARWDECDRTWSLNLEETVGTIGSSSHITQQPRPDARDNSTNDESLKPPTPTLFKISHIFFATGTLPNVNAIPCLRTFKSDHPIPSINGLPQINNDLMWTDDIPLFVTGALAGLRLGPGAGNLAGARLGAERVAWGIESVLGSLTQRQRQRRRQRSDDGSQAPLSDDKERVERKWSEGGDSAYASEFESDGNTHTSDESKDGIQRRSEFTGGFYNQFDAISA